MTTISNVDNKLKTKSKYSWLEKIGERIPDPIVIFMILYAILFLVSWLMGGKTFETISPDGSTISYQIKNMASSEGVRWIFSNAILNNWLGYAGGILGTILIVMFGIGTAEESGLLSALIQKVGVNISDRFLPYALVFLGIMSNIATDAGYVVLVPLAGLLYLGIGKNPLIGMAAAFAGVSAGFSANLIPATVVDVIIGTNAKGFAESQGVPFISSLGKQINPATMHYFFMVASTFVLVLLGGFVTNKWVKPKFEATEYVIPEDIDISKFKLDKKENKALKWTLLGLFIALAIVAFLGFFPLKNYIDETGKEITPFVDNIILIITFIFFTIGVFYGISVGKFKKSNDVIVGVSKQVGSMGYVIVLTFFSYNFLALLNYCNIGTYITYLGARGLEKVGLSKFPILLILGFILITGIINLFVGGLSSKWMLLGPIFIPMLYQANSAMTPDIVAAAYRVADSSTNIITPLMTYAGIILLYMRKYKPNFTIGNLIGTMLPYSLIFIVSWTILLIGFIVLKIPLGF